MSDSITEVSEKSWGARLMESIKGVLVGLALFIAAFPVLFMNEGCAVKTARDLGILAKEVIERQRDRDRPGQQRQARARKRRGENGRTAQRPCASTTARTPST